MTEELVEKLRDAVTYGYMPRLMREVANEAADTIEALQAALAARDGEIEALHKRIVEQRDEIIRLDLDLCEISKGEDW